MAKYRSKAPFGFHTPFIDGEVQPGSVHDLPDTQPNGADLEWPDEFWELLEAPKVSETPAPEGENN